MPWSMQPRRPDSMTWSLVAGASVIGLVAMIVAVHVLARST